MHLKDIEAAVVNAHKATTKAVAVLCELANTISEADHRISVEKELAKGNAIVAMAEKVEALEGELAKLQKKEK